LNESKKSTVFYQNDGVQSKYINVNYTWHWVTTHGVKKKL
jgi:hypothetical protein